MLSQHRHLRKHLPMEQQSLLVELSRVTEFLNTNPAPIAQEDLVAIQACVEKLKAVARSEPGEARPEAGAHYVPGRTVVLEPVTTESAGRALPRCATHAAPLTARVSYHTSSSEVGLRGVPSPDLQRSVSARTALRPAAACSPRLGCRSPLGSPGTAKACSSKRFCTPMRTSCTALTNVPPMRTDYQRSKSAQPVRVGNLFGDDTSVRSFAWRAPVCMSLLSPSTPNSPVQPPLSAAVPVPVWAMSSQQANAPLPAVCCVAPIWADMTALEGVREAPRAVRMAPMTPSRATSRVTSPMRMGTPRVYTRTLSPGAVHRIVRFTPPPLGATTSGSQTSLLSRARQSVLLHESSLELAPALPAAPLAAVSKAPPAVASVLQAWAWPPPSGALVSARA